LTDYSLSCTFNPSQSKFLLFFLIIIIWSLRIHLKGVCRMLRRGFDHRVFWAALGIVAMFGLSLPIDAGSQTIQPTDFEYLGAFRLPGGDDRPKTFAYGGNAMTFNPDGDPSGPNDGFPGSLFITGHDRLAYGDLPDGDQVAEVTIPVPVQSKDLDQLNTATFEQDFQNVFQGMFTTLAEIPRVGMLYLHRPETGSKLHVCFGQHFQEDAAHVASHAWIEPTLSSPNPKGTWYIGDQSLYSVNGYMFEVPASWADTHVGGRYIATGRYRDGGWSGQGPALFAYKPWTDASGAPAAAGTHLDEAVLLLYENSMNTTDVVTHSLAGYQHADEWEGGAWITTSAGSTAVLFAGTKGTGAKYWYGWVNPAGPGHPCVETEMIGQFPLCRNADGTQCDEVGCTGHNDYRGWWSSSFEARFILYDPTDLARVASNEIQPWQPQPYATIGIDDSLLLNPMHVEEDMLGTGVQRKTRIGDVAYDRANNLLYVLELFADGAKPVVHVWRISNVQVTQYTLTVTKSGTGSGTITSNPSGIDCGSDCSEAYNEGTNVTLTATASVGSTFGGWSGACSGTGTCSVTMNSDKTVVATFTPTPQAQYALTVTKSGTGSGTVTSSPAGINCGYDCSETYAKVEKVVLTAEVDANSAFTGWSGGGCSGTGTCTVTVNAAMSVTATFDLQAAGNTLTVVKSGTGTGTVTSSPAGINCGDDCSETYSKVQKVKLTAKADASSTFTGWSGGGCSRTKTCTVTVDGSVTVTADFALKTPDISVAQTPIEFGSIKGGKKATKTLKIMNNGSGDLVIALSVLDGTDFSIQGSSSVIIKPKKSYTLKVLFTPKSAGSKTANLEVSSNDPDTPTIDISLSGTGQ
jgi:hypothetical protein